MMDWKITHPTPDQAILARWWVQLNCWVWPGDLPGRPTQGGVMGHHESNIAGAVAVVEAMLADEGRAEVDRIWQDERARNRVLARARH